MVYPIGKVGGCLHGPPGRVQRFGATVLRPMWVIWYLSGSDTGQNLVSWLWPCCHRHREQ